MRYRQYIHAPISPFAMLTGKRRPTQNCISICLQVLDLKAIATHNDKVMISIDKISDLPFEAKRKKALLTKRTDDIKNLNELIRWVLIFNVNIIILAKINTLAHLASARKTMTL